eukprot:scaffold5572_cov83-Skeletonema_dohrnii-CCMP3373.AAC.8
MASNTAAPPVALDNIPDDLICSICLTVPADPLVTPCDHVFCKPCIRQALNERNVCPIDRRPCTVGELKQLEGLSFRVWSGIQVKCGGHESGCAWRGSIADYATHVENNCTVGRNPAGNNVDNNSMEELETLRRENLELKEKLQETYQTLRSVSHQDSNSIQRLQAAIAEVAQERDSLRQSRDSLKAQLLAASLRELMVQTDRDSLRQSRDALQVQLNSRPPMIFNGSYDFGREEVTELSKLISVYYCREAPIEIDGNKIYNCVRRCYTAFDRNYEDNPDGYWYDMRMLLSTCLASGFFTVNQLNNIDSWYTKHFGR